MVLHQVKNWQNWKLQGCFMQFLRLIFVKKLQGASLPDPHRGRCPLDPHWGLSAAPPGALPPGPPLGGFLRPPGPHFSADFSILNSHVWYHMDLCSCSSSRPAWLVLLLHWQVQCLKFFLWLQAAMSLNQGTGRHRLEFLIGDRVLPYNMTVYQAIRQFTPTDRDPTDTDQDSDNPLGHTGIWVQTHTI